MRGGGDISLDSSALGSIRRLVSDKGRVVSKDIASYHRSWVFSGYVRDLCSYADIQQLMRWL